MISFFSHVLRTQLAQIIDPRTYLLFAILFTANMLILKYSNRPLRHLSISLLLGQIPSWAIWLSNW